MPGGEQFVDPPSQGDVVVVGKLAQPVDAERATLRILHCRSESVWPARWSIARWSGALIFRTSWLKFALNRELPDLGVPPLDLPLMVRRPAPPALEFASSRRKFGSSEPRSAEPSQRPSSAPEGPPARSSPPSRRQSRVSSPSLSLAPSIERCSRSLTYARVPKSGPLHHFKIGE